MKSSWCILLILLCTQFLYAQRLNVQNDQATQLTVEQYQRNHKSFKTAGWITLGAGVGLLIAGGAQAAQIGNSDNEGSGLVIGGAILAVLSIPLFVAARANKNKAQLILKNENTYFNGDSGTDKKYIAFGVKLEF